jgi:hypothetical protein
MSFDEQPDGDPHGECAAEIRRLQAEVQMLRETIDAMETMPTGMSPAVCRAMAKYWNGLADRIARDGSVRGDGNRYCHCADPENCTEAVPNYICKAGKSCSAPSDAAEQADADGSATNRGGEA